MWGHKPADPEHLVAAAAAALPASAAGHGLHLLVTGHSPTNSSKVHLNAEQLPQNNF